MRYTQGIPSAAGGNARVAVANTMSIALSIPKIAVAKQKNRKKRSRDARQNLRKNKDDAKNADKETPDKNSIMSTPISNRTARPNLPERLKYFSTSVPESSAEEKSPGPTPKARYWPRGNKNTRSSTAISGLGCGDSRDIKAPRTRC